VLLVIFHHLAGTRGFPLSYQDLRWIDLGNLGVRIFFVLSGFLITGLLLREQREHGRISLGHFYFRRALRIFPAYYVFLAFLLLVDGWLVTLKPGDMLYAATFTDNYNACCHGPFVAHTWSLGVEEQFYLLWPAILLLAGATGGFRLAALFVLAAPVIRLGFWYLMPEERWGIGTRFETVGDALAVGCLLAGLRDRLFATPVYRRLLESPGMLMVPLGVLALATLDRPRIEAAVGVTLMNLGIAAMIDWCVRNPAGAVGRMLNWRPMVAVGVVSYSLYLWQSPFLNRFAGTAISEFPLNIVLLGLAALASYLLVERPALALRQRLERRWKARPSRMRGEAALRPVVVRPSGEDP
jgi:peptidoglycan/LPS O-acetylase OafA/YrhL